MSLNKSYNYNIGTMGNINVTGLTTGTINVSGLSTLINTTVTNVSTGTINASTGITAGSAQITNIVGTTISAGTLIGTTITGGNLSLSGNLIVAGTLTTVNITSTNLVDTNISAGSLNATTATIPNIVGTTISAGTVRATSNLIAVGNSNTLGNIYTTGGNVGIGITTPRTNLEITQSSSTTGVMLYSGLDDGGVNSLFFHHSNLASTYRKVAIQSQALGSGQSARANLALCVNTSVDTSNASMSDAKFFIHGSSGNIGIGTVTPGVTLDVKGQQYISPSSFTTTAGAGQSLLVTYPKLTINTNTNAWPAASGSVGSNIALRLRGNDDAALDFGVNSVNAWLQCTNFNNGYSSNYNIVLNPNGGNVGIATGTSSPSFPLHVNGGAYITGGITVGNTITLNDSRILLRGGSDVAHGLAWNSGPDGPSLWGNLGGTLAYGGSGATRVLTWNSTGVGIGTNSPSYKLDVNGSIRTTTAAGGLLIGTSTDTGRLISALSNMSVNDTSMITFGQGNSANNQAELGFNYIGNGSTSNALTLGLHGGEKMRIRADGSIGVGTISPQLTFHVAASNLGDTIRIENTNASGYACAQFKTTTSTYYIGVGGASASNIDLRDKLYILNGNGIVMNSSGQVGIGTKNPGFPLHVNGDSYSGTTPSYAYLAYNGSLATGAGNFGNQAYSIYSSGKILASEFNAFSDERIKKDIVDVDDISALAILRQIQPKQYKYKDVAARGTQPVWGFIAQQVASVLDYSTKIIKDFIPNIYEVGDVTDTNTITLTTKTTSELVVDKRIRLVTSDDKMVETKITGITGSHSFTIEDSVTTDKVFVYGVEVDDFHSLNKDAIFTIATAALQEVDRELQATKTELQSEKEKIARLEQFIESKFPGEF